MVDLCPPCGETVSQVAGDKETAADAAKDIKREIRTGKFDITAMKAARAAEKVVEAPAVLTLRDYYEKTVQALWEGSLSRNTQLGYDGSFRVHIIPAWAIWRCTMLPEIELRSSWLICEKRELQCDPVKKRRIASMHSRASRSSGASRKKPFAILWRLCERP